MCHVPTLRRHFARSQEFEHFAPCMTLSMSLLLGHTALACTVGQCGMAKKFVSVCNGIWSIHTGATDLVLKLGNINMYSSLFVCV